MIDVRIPKLGMSTVEVDILEVLVEVGATVHVGDVLVDVESEKASYQIEADVGGTVTEIVVTAGETYEVGDLVMRIAPDGVDPVSEGRDAAD